MQFDWPYFELRADGAIFEPETGYVLRTPGTQEIPKFKSLLEAESYLEYYDIRGSIRA